LIRIQLFHSLFVFDELLVALDRNLHRHVLVVGLNTIAKDLHEIVDSIQPVVRVHCNSENVRLHIQVILHHSDALVSQTKIHETMVVRLLICNS